MALTDIPWSGISGGKLYLQSGQFTSTLKTSLAAVSPPADISFDSTDSLWCAVGKLYLQSGQFTSTIKTSEDVSGLSSSAIGISFDGTDTPWTENAGDKLYLQSGEFSG